MGGVNLMFYFNVIYGFCKGWVLFFDSCCKIFDVSVDGYVRGEGCGIIVVKCFWDVVVDGDCILVLVKGFVINYDGFSSGLIVFN